MSFFDINDAQNRYSPALATEIGLEASALLCGLIDASRTASCQDFEGYRWFLFNQEQLEFLFPFWTASDIHRVIQKLQDLGYLFLDGNYLDTQHLHFAFNPAPMNAAKGDIGKNSSQPTHNKVGEQQNIRNKAYVLGKDWQPEPNGLQLLYNQGIPQQFVRGCIAEFVYDAREKNQARDDWNSQFRKRVLSKWRQQEAEFLPENFNREPFAMHNDWQPNIDAKHILERAGIDTEFINEKLPEFILYWCGKGVARNTWDHDFVKYARLEWAQEKNMLEHNSAPHIISKEWQITADVYDALAMAQIPADFAQSKVPEFVLYWYENKKQSSNWGYKFFQHIKRLWIKENEKQHGDHAKSTAEQDFVELHTDSSWANDL